MNSFSKSIRWGIESGLITLPTPETRSAPAIKQSIKRQNYRKPLRGPNYTEQKYIVRLKDRPDLAP